MTDHITPSRRGWPSSPRTSTTRTWGVDEAGVTAAPEALRNPDSRVLVHCHMGVNRGPSVGFAVLMALGFTPRWVGG